MGAPASMASLQGSTGGRACCQAAYPSGCTLQAAAGHHPLQQGSGPYPGATVGAASAPATLQGCCKQPVQLACLVCPQGSPHKSGAAAEEHHLLLGLGRHVEALLDAAGGQRHVAAARQCAAQHLRHQRGSGSRAGSTPGAQRVEESGWGTSQVCEARQLATTPVSAASQPHPCFWDLPLWLGRRDAPAADLARGWAAAHPVGHVPHARGKEHLRAGPRRWEDASQQVFQLLPQRKEGGRQAGVLVRVPSSQHRSTQALLPSRTSCRAHRAGGRHDGVGQAGWHAARMRQEDAHAQRQHAVGLVPCREGQHVRDLVGRAVASRACPFMEPQAGARHGCCKR